MTGWVITGWVLEATGPLPGAHPLHGVDTEEVLELTGASDPMDIDGYPLPPERWGWAERATGLELDPAFDYYIVARSSRRESGGEDGPGGPSEALTPPTVAELLELRLADEVSYDRAARLEHEIAQHGLEEVLPAAQRLLEAEAPSEREAGAGILGSLAGSRDEEKRAAGVPELVRVIEAESDPKVLASAAFGFGALAHMERLLGLAPDTRALEPLLRLAEHPDDEIRRAVAIALPHVVCATRDERGVRALIELTADPYDQVRDWATSGLGECQELDGSEVSRALEERRADDNLHVRYAALDGLGRRGDIEALAEALRYPDGELIRTAERAADPVLYEPLLAAKAGGGPWAEDLERAIAACRPK